MQAAVSSPCCKSCSHSSSRHSNNAHTQSYYNYTCLNVCITGSWCLGSECIGALGKAVLYGVALPHAAPTVTGCHTKRRGCFMTSKSCF
jgi:hypothetical protein